MKIAVTYEDGKIFQHFGKSKAFKVYEVSDNKVVSSDILDPNGVGHEALADVLADQGVSVLICGGLGGGAQAALSSAGIEVFSGAEGDADAAVESYLAGTLESAGVNCDHHDHEHGEGGCGGCGHHEEEGSGCGGCGGCGSHELTVLYEGKNAGKTVKAHYCGTLDDGSQFDSSYDRGEPLEFVAGVGMMIAGFDKAVVNMEVGETVNVHLEPSEAYGEVDPQAIFTVPMSQMPGVEELAIGDRVALSNPYGQQFPVVVKDKTETEITFDANHDLAGKALNFKIELVSVAE
ncbi:MAG: FKBP-type peptidyl-prolyl cis-trans isomerase [Lachnospiraceae bacterium]|nr:FKBP-type peptidyl-prolyl cis-trans isomerase [Lachnospiraceae bacterium]MBQ5484661.1 FKBP-type peptidyl-prolyl cis-trans isomerase [Lachnospiraceae bacterium]